MYVFLRQTAVSIVTLFIRGQGLPASAPDAYRDANHNAYLKYATLNVPNMSRVRGRAANGASRRGAGYARGVHRLHGHRGTMEHGQRGRRAARQDRLDQVH